MDIDIDLGMAEELDEEDLEMIDAMWDDERAEPEVFVWDELDDIEDYLGMILTSAQDAEDYDDVNHLKMCLSEIATYAEQALAWLAGE